MLHGEHQWMMLVDDYIGRPSYRVIADFADFDQCVGRMAVFKAPKNVDLEVLDRAIRSYEVILD
ncbi:hypothetical protein [Mycolicibacterium mengxianglii]|uniref:hypothetical protein n=1 Tax=Mycolicibacterium mengxianglii TaxID=2736649 RepID=UPI0018D014E2|nr:hypothetical protein [Mycolicibacterium mengxianglii]